MKIKRKPIKWQSNIQENIFMKGGSTSAPATTTTTQTSEPWSGQKPDLQYIFSEARKQYNSSSPSYYPNDTIAPQSQATQDAIQAEINRATNGSPALQASENQLTSTANGDYLGSNPYLDQQVQAANDQITRAYQTATSPRVDATFEAAGRAGSGAANQYASQARQDLLQSLSNTDASMYGNNYQNERANQMKAIYAAPSLSAADYTDINALANAGATQDAYAQNQLNQDISKYNYDQQLPAAKLAQYMQMIQGNYGGTSTTETPYFPAKSNTLGNAIGGGLSGAAAGSMFGPWGAGIGAGVGILGGLFG